MKNEFVFVTPFYNCADDISRTILSMASQSSDAWRAILINDMSTDNSLDVVRTLCNSLPQRDRFTIIDNVEKHGEVRNTLAAAKLIDDSNIVCRLDGGDWLVDNDLLWVLDQAYQDEQLAVAWTAQRWGYTPQNISSHLTLLPGQTVYQHPWVSSHLKTFRCDALKSVPDANFRTDDGDYIMIACDQAIFLPMMHSAILRNKKLAFIPIVGYHYNIQITQPGLFHTERAYKQRDSALMIRARGFLEK